MLRLLQSGGVRGRWQLKSPHHCIALEALTARYPDARFVVTHRDPATCVASTASLGRAFARTFAHPGDAEFGELWTEMLVAMSDGIVDFRREHGDDRFVDVSYSELTTDPLGTMRRIYESSARPRRCRGGGDPRPRGCRSAASVRHHQYQVDDFVVDRASLDERFARTGSDSPSSSRSGLSKGWQHGSATQRATQTASRRALRLRGEMPAALVMLDPARS